MVTCGALSSGLHKITLPTACVAKLEEKIYPPLGGSQHLLYSSLPGGSSSHSLTFKLPMGLQAPEGLSPLVSSEQNRAVAGVLGFPLPFVTLQAWAPEERAPRPGNQALP